MSTPASVDASIPTLSIIGTVAILGISGIGIDNGTEGVHNAHHQAPRVCLHAPLTNPPGSLGPEDTDLRTHSFKADKVDFGALFLRSNNAFSEFLDIF